MEPELHKASMGKVSQTLGLRETCSVTSTPPPSDSFDEVINIEHFHSTLQSNKFD